MSGRNSPQTLDWSMKVQAETKYVARWQRFKFPLAVEKKQLHSDENLSTFIDTDNVIVAARYV